MITKLSLSLVTGKLDGCLGPLQAKPLPTGAGTSQELMVSVSLPPDPRPAIWFLVSSCLWSSVLWQFSPKYSHVDHFMSLVDISRVL